MVKASLPTTLVAAKLEVPTGPERLVPRSRLVNDLARLVDDHRVVLVTAAAGAGKTTAVRESVAHASEDTAWLTLDDTEAAPGRLLLYLEAALRRAAPDLAPQVEHAMSSGVLHPETAALLAGAVGDRPLLLVVDELERLADSPGALAVLSTFVRYSSPSVRLILISRREVEIDALSRMGIGAVGALDERSLAFTVPEAAEAIRLAPDSSTDPASVVVATGGWVSGVLFEAWRSRHHVPAAGGSGDPLNGYLTAQILESLDEKERDFLVVTSVLREVDGPRARQLGVRDAGAILAELRPRHLPVTWNASGRSMRCHPRFREYLRSELDKRDPRTVRTLLRRLGRLLAAEGLAEEAVSELLEGGDVAEAAKYAPSALPAVIARLDLDLADEWLGRFAAHRLLDTAALLDAELHVAVGREDFPRAVAAADSLRDVQADSSPAQRALAAWSYWHVGRTGDARSLLGSPQDPDEFVSQLWSLMDHGRSLPEPRPIGGPLDALLLRIAYARGRLTDIRDAPRLGWGRSVTEQIPAIRALGDSERTQALLDEARETLHLSNLRLEGTVQAELLIDLRQAAAARAALAAGRERIIRSGSAVFEMVWGLVAAKLELRLARDPERATEHLRRVEAVPACREYAYIAEQVDMWRGLACLMRGDDAAARALLEDAVDSMVDGDRVLELPTAAVYLAEARWRAGDPAGSDAAADAALAAAAKQGSRHLLLQALEDVPGVVARQADAESSSDDVWHELARALALRGRISVRPVRPRIVLSDIGPPFVDVDGQRSRPRIVKTCTLLAYLVQARRPVRRAELLRALFDGRADESARAYLRQALHGLRGLLPDGVEVVTDADSLELSAPDAVASASTLLVARLADAARLTGAERLQAIEGALAQVPDGVFLEGDDTAWAADRRQDLQDVLLDARTDLAVSALEAYQFGAAEAALLHVLANDPYRERAWRMLMRVAASRAEDDRVLTVYRRCEEALAKLDLEPSETTRRLLSGLRR